MNATPIVGYIAMIGVASLNVPQLIHTYRLKSAREISWWFLLNNCAVCALSSTYGLLIQKPPIYVANMINFMNAFALACMKYVYDRDRFPRPPDQGS